jgi:hypothetical protein
MITTSLRFLCPHPNTRRLACAFHNYWVERYDRQFQKYDLGPGPRVSEIFGLETSRNPPKAPPPYREPEDDKVFKEVLVRHELPLDVVPLRGV